MLTAANDMTAATSFDENIAPHINSDTLSAGRISIVQVNVGLACNMQCVHCHVASGPWRTEEMSRETWDRVMWLAEEVRPERVDLTGGAPELHPQFHAMIGELHRAGHPILVRTNLTVLSEPGLQDLPALMRECGVELVASLPCYLEENVTTQRGEGAFQRSIEILRMLNGLGYGIENGPSLTLVYNPVGPYLPPPQSALEEDYRRELGSRFGISFSRLLAITNMPIGRFWGDLKKSGREKGYLRMLQEKCNPRTLPNLMCRSQINIGWDGMLFDCDFNLALQMPVHETLPQTIHDLGDTDLLNGRRIVTGQHCFGCTAGCGSSCGGALDDSSPADAEQQV